MFVYELALIASSSLNISTDPLLFMSKSSNISWMSFYEAVWIFNWRSDFENCSYERDYLFGENCSNHEKVSDFLIWTALKISSKEA